MLQHRGLGSRPEIVHSRANGRRLLDFNEPLFQIAAFLPFAAQALVENTNGPGRYHGDRDE